MNRVRSLRTLPFGKSIILYLVYFLSQRSAYMTHDRFGGGLLGRFAPSVSKSPLKKADHATIWATNKHIMGPGVVGDMALVCGPQAEAAIWCSCGGCGAFCELESCGAATVRLLQQCAALRTRFVPSYNTCTDPPFLHRILYILYIFQRSPIGQSHGTVKLECK